MPGQHRPLFDSSFDALVLLHARNATERRLRARRPCGIRRPGGRSATAMSIQFAPEPVPTACLLALGEDETTGPLPLGFEFELFGLRYTSFDLSSDGFMTLGTDASIGSERSPSGRFIPLNAALSNFIALGMTDGCSLGRRQVAYEVRGVADRRRLVLSLSVISPPPDQGQWTMSAQLILHERTGMIDLHTTRQVAHCINQAAVRYTTAPW